MNFVSRAAGKFSRALYAAWSLSLFALLISVAAVLALLVPWLPWRRALTRGCARLWLGLVGLRVRTTGLELLPHGSCVLVANHSSYLDGIVLTAVLPPRFGFVVKREAASMPIAGLLLRRIGAEFVDRHSRGGRQRDARRVVERAEQGHSLVFFPEGTFDAERGLRRFHLGAFVAAARSGVPLVPVVIHGARRALPGETRVPRPGRLHVEVLPPIGGRDETPEHLRDTARGLVLERLGEPDLARQRAPAPTESLATSS
ncbi:MAG TPA: lysophospholipid acyltransferase family protein [Steroidobacteraceae bacterium]|nr:lysophospholipid acyltransferase family protein [Steroidobacteraceae bacterium]